MSKQYDLFGGTPPHVRASDTSKAAAVSVKESALAIRVKILRLIRTSGAVGMTCDEVEDITGYRHQSASARIRELVLKNQIKKAGRRATRSGRQANVYVASKEKR